MAHRKPQKIKRNPQNHAIILAAGSGQRMRTRKDKLLLPVAGKPLLYYTIMVFNDHPEITTVTLVTNKANKEEIQKITKTYNFHKVKNITLGGLTRQDSLEKGLRAIEKTVQKEDAIIVHNGANPLVSQEEITTTIEKTEKHGACIVGHDLASTIKEIDDQHIIKTHNRKNLFAAQTPQAAKYGILIKALAHAKKADFEATDEAMLLEEAGYKVAFTKASEENFKVTTQADYDRLRTILGELPDDFRIGLGQDSHMFEEEKSGLTLGGILLKDELKLKANSDGDVILHAIFNALSQAIGDKSIGFYADEECEKGIRDSGKYLEIVLKNVKKQKFKVNSLGLMIECKKPKIDPIVPDLKKSLSKMLDLHSRRIGITATTGEELTAFGQGLGIQCFAIVSLVK